MHMADALVSPAVGGSLWAAAAAMIACSSMKVRRSLDERKVPLMGVLGAFVFAAQMINFTVPATGSSGHLGGGLLLAILLGPSAAFLTITSVLMVQALFFSDGGLLALGCNIINLGFFPVFIAFPLLYRRLVGHRPSQSRLVFASIVAAITGLQLGSLGVVLQTVASGISSLPFTTFLLLMQPIHLAIGVIEGIVTALIVWFVYHARPDVLNSALQDEPIGNFPVRSMVITFLAAAMLIGGSLSWYASTAPDGLEWSISRISGKENLPDQEDQTHERLATFQARTALLADYSLPGKDTKTHRDLPGKERLETSLAGIVGSAVTLAVCLVAGLLLRKRSMSQEFSAQR
ncbi:MAG: energy-coupling factor ABC transporter permease [Desulfuromonadales bacterium]